MTPDLVGAMLARCRSISDLLDLQPAVDRDPDPPLRSLKQAEAKVAVEAGLVARLTEIEAIHRPFRSIVPSRLRRIARRYGPEPRSVARS